MTMTTYRDGDKWMVLHSFINDKDVISRQLDSFDDVEDYFTYLLQLAKNECQVHKPVEVNMTNEKVRKLYDLTSRMLDILEEEDPSHA